MDRVLKRKYIYTVNFLYLFYVSCCKLPDMEQERRLMDYQIFLFIIILFFFFLRCEKFLFRIKKNTDIN